MGGGEKGVWPEHGRSIALKPRDQHSTLPMKRQGSMRKEATVSERWLKKRSRCFVRFANYAFTAKNGMPCSKESG